MNKQTTIITASVAAVIIFSAVAFFFFQKKPLEIPSASTPVEKKQETELGAELLKRAQNPLAEAAVTTNPFRTNTNPFTADANLFNAETNPLKSFYQNPFQ